MTERFETLQRLCIWSENIKMFFHFSVPLRLFWVFLSAILHSFLGFFTFSFSEFIISYFLWKYNIQKSNFRLLQLWLANGVSNRSWDFHVLFTTSKTHDIARIMTSKNLLLFRITNWNDLPTHCSFPSSQIVPYWIFYCLDFFPSRNLLWPEINRTMQSSLPYTVLCNIYSVHSIFR